MNDFYERLNEAIKKTVDVRGLYYHFKFLDEVTKLAYLILNNTPRMSLRDYSTYVHLNESVENVAEFFDSINPMYSNMFLNTMKGWITFEKKDVVLDNVEADEKDIDENYVGFKWDGGHNRERCGMCDVGHECRNRFEPTKYAEDGPEVRFYKRLKNGEQREYDGQSESSNSCVCYEGIVTINFENTLFDAFNIAHELTHKFSKGRRQDSTIKNFFGETTSIAMEFLLQDYFLNNSNYPINEIVLSKNNRCVYTFFSAENIIFQNSLLKLYKENNNCITEEVLLNYYNSLDKDSVLYRIFSNRGEHLFSSIIESDELKFPIAQRYVIGVLFASDIHDKIQNNPCEIEKLFSLINILNHTDYTAEEDLSALERMGIPGVKNGELRFDDADICRLTSCYLKEVKDAISPRSREESPKLMVKVGETQE